jgi:hypothetical protein
MSEELERQRRSLEREVSKEIRRRRVDGRGQRELGERR